MKRIWIVAAILAAGLASALTPEEKEAQEKARAEAKASEEAWRALRKEAEDLAQKDFKGGFADYWHDHLDAARALLDLIESPEARVLQPQEIVLQPQLCIRSTCGAKRGAPA